MGADIEVPPDAKMIETSGKTLLPGLIDAHTHVWELTCCAQPWFLE